MADETYWTWKPASPTPSYDELPDGCFSGTCEQWHSLSPGMRREIARDFYRRRVAILQAADNEALIG